ELPLAISFFRGKRLVSIMTAFYCTFLVVILLFLWTLLYSWIVKFGESIVGLGSFGAFIYGVANRLLIPTGLHHALNSVFWFDTIGINDIGKFQSVKDAI
ncbi:PTS transporter subunit EIIC, partial [Staphylococcus aureus]|uniref:PTS transporter subunit EIIC n=1 Tax=Staphylococcus aureus TaxID=1280 RepID=UPI0010DF2C64